MKTYLKTKANTYKNVLLQDESGLVIIKVKKRMSALLNTWHLLQLSAQTVSKKATA